MNVLILGDSSATVLRDFCTRVFADKKDNVCIFSYTNQSKFSELYDNMGIKEIYIMPYFENCPIRITNIIPTLIRKVKEVKKLLPFTLPADIIHVHYVEPSLLIYLFILWLTARKRILTFWGSDILRISEDNKKLLVPFLYMASSIIFMIPNQYKIFSEIYGDHFKNKVHIIDMGNDILDCIDTIRYDSEKAEIKHEFGFSSHKKTIHVGYNRQKEQQHINVLEQICLLPEAIKARIQIVLPWGYGSVFEEEIYEKEIKNLLDANGIDYIFVNDFFTGEKLAMFRMTCDIFVYAQTTDAMSDSSIEYAYAGSLFLCPEWLWKNYSLINCYTDQCIKYLSFNNLYDVLYKILSNNDIKFSNSIGDEMHQTIYKNKAWRFLTPKWRKLYKKKEKR